MKLAAMDASRLRCPRRNPAYLLPSLNGGITLDSWLGSAGGSQYTIWKPVHQVGHDDSPDGRDKEMTVITTVGHPAGTVGSAGPSDSGHERTVIGRPGPAGKI